MKTEACWWYVSSVSCGVTRALAVVAIHRKSIPFRAAVLVAALAASLPALSGQVHAAAKAGDSTNGSAPSQGTATVQSAVDSKFWSKWDAGILQVEFRNISIEGSSIDDALRQMGCSLMLRSCLYHDVKSDADAKHFAFQREVATGQEVMDAFLAAYPDYTFTQDPKTGILWIHRKYVKYEEIFDQKVKVERSVEQVPVYTSILVPLFGALGSTTSTREGVIRTWSDQFVDLPAGEYSVRDALNICLVQVPVMFFNTWPPIDDTGLERLYPDMLVEPRPLGMVRIPSGVPRMGDIALWNSIMRTNAATNAPTLEEIGAALSNPDPKKRWVASRILFIDEINYSPYDYFRQFDNTEKAVWVALELPNQRQQAFLQEVNQMLTNEPPKLKPGLALLAAMMVGALSKDPDILDSVAKHRISNEEFAIIRPEFLWIARLSKPVQDKLAQMDFAAPQLKAEVLSEVQNTNAVFALVAGSNKYKLTVVFGTPDPAQTIEIDVRPGRAFGVSTQDAAGNSYQVSGTFWHENPTDFLLSQFKMECKRAGGGAFSRLPANGTGVLVGKLGAWTRIPGGIDSTISVRVDAE